MSEIKRRWVVTSMDPGAVCGTPIRIKQGYLVTPADVCMSVHVADERTAWLRPVFRRGVEHADATAHEIALETATSLLHATSDVLSKRCYLRDGWQLDLYDEELSGLAILKRRVPSRATGIELPAWVHAAQEVTHSVSDQHLARFATELKGGETERPMLDYRHRRLPVILVTGDLTKRMIMEIVRRNCRSYRCASEVVSSLISQVCVHPPADGLDRARFVHRLRYRAQRGFEELSNAQAVRDYCQALVLDCGTLDAAVDMPNGTRELVALGQTTLADEHAYYDLVICLETPSPEIYQVMVANDPTWRESYAQAIELSAWTKRAWSSHPRCQVIPAETSWELRVQQVQSIIGYELDRSVY